MKRPLSLLLLVITCFLTVAITQQSRPRPPIEPLSIADDSGSQVIEGLFGRFPSARPALQFQQLSPGVA